MPRRVFRRPKGGVRRRAPSRRRLSIQPQGGQGDYVSVGRPYRFPRPAARRRALVSMVNSHEHRIYTGGNAYQGNLSTLTFNAFQNFTLAFSAPPYSDLAIGNIDRSAMGAKYRLLNESFRILIANGANTSVLLRWYWVREHTNISNVQGGLVIDPVTTAGPADATSPFIARHPNGWIKTDDRTVDGSVTVSGGQNFPTGGAHDRFFRIAPEFAKVIKSGAIFLAGNSGAPPGTDLTDTQYRLDHRMLNLSFSHGRTGKKMSLFVAPNVAGAPALGANTTTVNTRAHVLLLWLCRADAGTPPVDGSCGIYYQRRVRYVDDV